MPTLRKWLHPHVVVREAGALDGLSEECIRDLAPGPGGTAIETRLRCGTHVVVDKKRLMPFLLRQAWNLQKRCDHLVLLCSGEFPELRAACRNLIEPVVLLRGIVRALAGQKLLGIVGPASDLASAPSQWRPYAGGVVCAAASPYGETVRIAAAAATLAGQGAEIILLDDMGFTEVQQRAARARAGLPVLCATTLTARVLAELTCSGRDGGRNDV